MPQDEGWSSSEGGRLKAGGAEVIGPRGVHLDRDLWRIGGAGLRDGVGRTSGNSYTTWSAMCAVEAACHRSRRLCGEVRGRVVGATGVIGQALSLSALKGWTS